MLDMASCRPWGMSTRCPRKSATSRPLALLWVLIAWQPPVHSWMLFSTRRTTIRLNTQDHHWIFVTKPTTTVGHTAAIGSWSATCRLPRTLSTFALLSSTTTLFASSSSSSPLSDLSSSTAKSNNNVRSTKKSRKARARKLRSQNNSNNNSNNKDHLVALSEQDLADHVSYMYIHGPGGIMYKKPPNKRSRLPSTTLMTSAIMAAGGSTVRQAATTSVSTTMTMTTTTTTTTTTANSIPSHHARDDVVEEHTAFVQMLDRHPALLLNADYQPLSHLPLSIWNWQETIKAVFSGKVTVVDVYPDVSIRAVHIKVPLPSVIALNEYVPAKHHQQRPAFTKRNVFLRDEYRCQYCTGRFHTRDLSLDHVVPRCMGGSLSWDNAVTCCRTCNGKKGSLSVSDLRSVGMRLLRPPTIPSQYELAAIAGRMLPRRVHPTWEPYLGVSSVEKLHSRTAERFQQQQQQQQREVESTQ